MGMTSTDKTPEWVPTAILAEEWGIPERTLAQWRYLDKGPKYYRFGRHVRYRRSDIEAWLKDQATSA